MATDGSTRRVPVPTEKGEHYQTEQKENLIKRVQLAGFMLNETIKNLQTLPKTIATLENAEADLRTTYTRYDKDANEYMDYLSRSRDPDSQKELETYWVAMTELKKQYNFLIDKIQSEYETLDNKSDKKSTSTRRSGRSLRSNTSEAALKRAKALSEKVKLKFVEKEAELKLEQFNKTLQIGILEQQKNLAAAEVEAQYLEENAEQSIEPPKEELGPFEKTLQFLDNIQPQKLSEHEDSKQQEKTHLSPGAKPFEPKATFNTSPKQKLVTSTPRISQPIDMRNSVSSSYGHQVQDDKQFDNFQQPSFRPTSSDIQGVSNTEQLDPSIFLMKRNLLLETFQQQKFNDKPDRYIIWKKQFKVMTQDIKCTPLEEITLLTNCVSNGSEAFRLIMSTRSSCADDPSLCLSNIWERLDQRFGSPELLESALKAKLQKLPNMIDRKALYELYDVLCEIQAVKNIPEYTMIFSYLDSSLGIRPIVQKLPKFLQDKWVNRVVNFKRDKLVLFPPFSELVRFVHEISVVRNDPGLMFESPTNTFQNRNTGKPQNQGNNFSKPKGQMISVHKTDITSNITTSTQRKPCLLHKNSKHSINECRVFQGKTTQDRKNILKEHNFCLRCCDTSDHFAKNCQAEIQCSFCKSTSHCSALHNDKFHNDQNQSPISPERKHGEEVSVRCTEICGVPGFTGKSCARIVPVRVYSQNDTENAILAYAMLDDQSSHTLAKSSLFDHFAINSSPLEYTLESCSGKSTIYGRLASGLVVEGIHDTCNIQLKLPSVIECDNIPDNHAEIPTPEIALHYPHMQDISDHLLPYNSSMKVMLLIGRDLPEAFHVTEQRIGPPRSPFAQRSTLGWTIIGDVCLSGQHHPTSVSVHDNFVSGNDRPSSLKPCEQVIRVCKTFVSNDRSEEVKLGDVFETTKEDNKPGLSIEDRKFLKIMDNDFKLGSDGKWEAPLPFREPHEPMPDNYNLALHRAKSLDSSLYKNETKKRHFLEFMQKIFDNNHAEIAPYLPPESEKWYLPLFGVYHPRKPEQIRGVFDSSAKFMNVSLNEQLLPGPDLINNLLGVLLRFRKEMVGVVADIQQMFHSFLVQENHRDFLRFLWHKDNLLENPLVTYRMKVHVFGNCPSPAIAMYGLRKIGDLAGETHGDDVKQYINNDFYVDDGLKSCPTSEDAISLIRKTQEAMKQHGNLRLHKFASNSKSVMDAFEPEDLAKGLVDLNFEKDSPTQRSLGLLWDLSSDTFKFNISTEVKPNTRRGILSSINSLYDPMGFIAPVIVQGKFILRKIVSSTYDWDDPLPEDLLSEWSKWSQTLSDLEDLRIPRVIVPNLNTSVYKELLTFCDASERAIAAVCYLRVRYSDGSSATGFVLGKSKLAPTSCTTIPRLELCSAVLAIEIAQNVVEYLQISIDNIKFFSDSKVTLGYIHNEKKRFYVYVANRVAKIRCYSKPSQWHYIRTENNPADVGTRDIHPRYLQDSAWLTGPTPHENNDQTSADYQLVEPDTDVEVRTCKSDITIQGVKSSESCLSKMFEKFSNWDMLVRALATIRNRIQSYLMTKRSGKAKMDNAELSLEVERQILRDVQQEAFKDEINLLKNSKPLHRQSAIFSLDPFIDENGLIRVGGRLSNLDSDSSYVNPIVLPRKHHITLLIVRKCHELVQHQGRHLTEGQIRSSGFWILGCKRLVSSVIHKCVVCRKLRQSPPTQKMSNLPLDRVTIGQPPFTAVGVDMFGPFEVVTRKTRGGAANSKRWGALFTCLVTRAVHIEIVEEMSTSSFINAMRRLIAIRGPVSVFRSDRGTNFVGTVNELNLNVINVEDGPIHNFLQQGRMTWIFNPPHASHMGGVWERMIGVTRRIFESMLQQHKSCLTHEVLSTFFAKASYIINSRPLVSVSTDPQNPTILTPSLLLTQKSATPYCNLIDLDNLDHKDMLRKHWKRVQHLAAVFWKRYKTEYLNTLQKRRKWTSAERNVSVGDIVLVRDKELPRSHWPMGIVTSVKPSDDGLVRTVEIKITVEGKPKSFIRPICEVVVLLEA